MKKYALALILVIAVSLPASAFALADINLYNNPSATATGGAATGGSVGAITNSPVQTMGSQTMGDQVFNPTNVDVNLNKNKNTAISSSESLSKAAQMNDWTQIWNSPQEFLANQAILPMPVPLIQGGRVGDVTKQVPQFAKLKRIGENDKWLEVKVKNGNIFDRVRLEDIEIDLLAFYNEVCVGKGKWAPAKAAYAVNYKDSTFGAGVSGGAQGGASGISGTGIAGQGSGGIIPSVGRSTADPAYTLKIYKLE